MLHIAAICVGASLGALSRWKLGIWLNATGHLPWGTLAANAMGGYLIGLVLAVLQMLPEIHPAWRLAIVTGFLGALTTFSTFSAEVVALLQAQRWATALLWALSHLFASLVLTMAGIWTANLFR